MIEIRCYFGSDVRVVRSDHVVPAGADGADGADDAGVDAVGHYCP